MQFRDDMKIGYVELGEMIIADTPYFMWGHPHDINRLTPERREFLQWVDEHIPDAFFLCAMDIVLRDKRDLMLYLLRWS